MPGRPADPHLTALGDCPGPEATPEERTRWVLARAMELGFHAAGVCVAAPSAEGDRLRAWLAAGRQGAMEWMRDHVDTRLDVRALHPGARSVLVVLLRYSDGSPDRVERAPAESATANMATCPAHRPRGRVARYARGPDYHDLMKRRLGRLQRELERANPGATGRRTCDIEPAMERELAVRAGLGRIGKHTLLISPALGSWTLIASLVTTVELAPTGPGPEPEDPCQSCTRCIDACPTRAIHPWSVDASRCISALTLEDRGNLDPALASLMGDWIGGCDICQEVCPHNQPTRRSRALGAHPSWVGGNGSFDLLAMLDWTDSQRRAAWRAGALRRMSASMAARNAVWALGNSGASWDSALQRVAGDGAAPDLARDAARDALSARQRAR